MVKCFIPDMQMFNVARGYILPPQTWSSKSLDINMTEGDHIYADIRMLK